MARILVTGGAGFIGSHTADALLAAGHQVQVLDNLEPQVHGPGHHWPAYLDNRVELVFGDVQDRAALTRAVTGVDFVFHLAALTGVGQSMYQLGKYFAINVQGTANLLDILANEPHHVSKLIVASSRAVYGEGAYRCRKCGLVTPLQRSPEQLAAHQWRLFCPGCDASVTPELTSESQVLRPASVYAITKRTTEDICLCFGQAYNFPVVVLRYFNVYGPRQSFSNPYTGIITVFLSRLLNGKPPEVYEDGQMTRDFVHVSDVVQANLLAMQQDVSNQIFNVGTGTNTTIYRLAELLCEMAAPALAPEIVHLARVGDIRHCTADLEAARKYLGYTPRVNLKQGLWSLLQEVGGPNKPKDFSSVARQELADSGLLK